jgi:hypothetical protein
MPKDPIETADPWLCVMRDLAKLEGCSAMEPQRRRTSPWHATQANRHRKQVIADQRFGGGFDLGHLLD